MIIKKKSIRTLLYRSFEEKLKPKEEARLRRALADSPELRAEKEEIIRLRQFLEERDKFNFSPHFDEKVLTKWRQEKERLEKTLSFEEQLSSIFVKLAYIGTAVAVVLVIINVILGDVLSSEEIFFASDSLYETLLHLPFF